MNTLALLLAENDNVAGNAAGAVFLIIYLAIIIVTVAGFWTTFTKAGQPGWACIVPIYNLYVLMKIAGRPGWWVLLCLIPLVSIIFVLIAYLDVANRFGKGAGFGIGLLFLPFIFFPILGFGDARYQGGRISAGLIAFASQYKT